MVATNADCPLCGARFEVPVTARFAELAYERVGCGLLRVRYYGVLLHECPPDWRDTQGESSARARLLSRIYGSGASSISGEQR